MDIREGVSGIREYRRNQHMHMERENHGTRKEKYITTYEMTHMNLNIMGVRDTMAKSRTRKY